MNEYNAAIGTDKSENLQPAREPIPVSCASNIDVDEAMPKSYIHDEIDTLENVKKSSFSDQLERRTNAKDSKETENHKDVYENIKAFVPDLHTKPGFSSHLTHLVSSHALESTRNNK